VLAFRAGRNLDRSTSDVLCGLFSLFLWTNTGTALRNKVAVGRPEGRRPLGRPRRRWEDNIKMDLGEIGFGDVDWIHWAQDSDRWRALVNAVMNLRVT
jgi:hypothetical protein